MGDVGDDFRAYKEMVKERKLERFKNNTEQLKDIDIPYTRDSNGRVIPPFLTEVISRIRSFVVDVALGYSHSTPCSAVRDYKTIATV
ncbi:Uncharacterised protein [Providencia stuartii]|nr:Uncharacterised protein [Providencia stuartii]